MSNSTRTIAIVDDDSSILQSLDRLLSAHGFHVQTFSSAESFLEEIVKSDADCLVSDINLGGMSGIDLKRRLTSFGIGLPVIFMTAVDSYAIRQEASNVGCIAYLSKPFPAKLLIDAIDKVP